MEMGRNLMEYCLNAVWLVPVVAGAASLLVKVARLRPAGEHSVWLGAMAVCLALPGLGVLSPRVTSPAMRQPLQVSAEAESEPLAVQPVSSGSVMPLPAQPVTFLKSNGRKWQRPIRRTLWVPFAPQVVRWFGWLYAGVVGFAVCRLVRTGWAAWRLVREATPYAITEAEGRLLQEFAAMFQVKTPRVLFSVQVQGPVVVGVWRTVLLLPGSFARCSEAERRAALCHELAHVRRRDCLVHAAVQALMLPLIWHPGVHLAARRIARTREMVCDEMAAAAMRSGADEQTYARCLLSLARAMVGGETSATAFVGLGLFRTNKLEERVMRLTEVKRRLTMRELFVRRLGCAAAAGVVLAVGAMVHVAPVVAQESGQGAPVPAPVPAKAAIAAAPSVPIPPSAAPAAAVPFVLPAPAMPQAAPSLAPLAPPEAEGIGEGTSVGDGPSGTGVDTDVFVDDHFAVARGRNAHVQVSKGRYLHRWVGADGEPYESADAQPQDLTAEQKRATEAEFARRMARLDAQVAFWKSPDSKHQLRQQAGQQASEEAALAKAAAELAAASVKLDSPEFKLQMQRLNSPEFKARMDAQMKALQSQMAKLESEQFKEQMAKLDSPEFEKQVADAARQAQAIDAPEIQHALEDAAKKMEAAAARLEAASKALEESRRRRDQQK